MVAMVHERRIIAPVLFRRWERREKIDGKGEEKKRQGNGKGGGDIRAGEKAEAKRRMERKVKRDIQELPHHRL